jgi:hypothetical protein
MTLGEFASVAVEDSDSVFAVDVEFGLLARKDTCREDKKSGETLLAKMNKRLEGVFWRRRDG